MASNLTQIATAINNLNVTYTDIATSDIVNQAIVTGNEQSNGWVGLIIFLILCASVMIFLLLNRNNFAIFTSTNFIFYSLSIWLDIGLYLMIWGILESFKIYMQLYTLLFLIAGISLLRKESISTEGE